MDTTLGRTIRCKHRWAARLLVFLVLSAYPTVLLASGEGQFIIDGLGRRVAVAGKADRIACMYAFTGHVVAMLGKANNIVAVSNGLQRDVLLTEMYPSIKKAVVPKVQGTINIEELAGVRPDIVFVQSHIGGNPAMADKLDAMGLAWIAVDFHNMAEQRRVIAMIGKTIGKSARADAYNNYYLSCIDRVHKALADIPPNKRLRVYHATVEPNRTSPRDSLSTDWISATGLINVTSIDDTGGLLNGNDIVGMEQIILWDPQVILANEPGVGAYIRNSPQWAPVTAVKTRRIYQLPIGISRWGHPGSLEIPMAILWTVKTIYPEKFQDIHLEAEINNFYQRFFNYEISDRMLEHILSGKGMRLNKKGKKRE